MSSKNSWICEAETEVLQTPIMSLKKRRCRLALETGPSDRSHDFFVLRSRDWCNIIPVTENGEVVLVKQFRLGIDDFTLEIPGGVWDPTDPDAEAAAIREMSEETGYIPLPEAHCEALGWSFTNPAILDNRVHAFVVGPVKKSSTQRLDSSEAIEVEAVPIARIPALIKEGKIRHALMLNTFLFLALRDARLSDSLVSELQSFLTT